jgi:hypothetical protein
LWQRFCRAFVVVEGQGELLHLVRALAPPGGFPGSLHRRQQQRDQNPNDRNDDQQLHQRKTSSTAEESHEYLRKELKKRKGTNTTYTTRFSATGEENRPLHTLSRFMPPGAHDRHYTKANI